MELPAAKGNLGREVFAVVEDAPMLLGGLDELQRRIQYPEIAKQAGVEGRVFLQFVVDKEGNVVDPQVVRGIGAGCDEEALRAIQTMKFVPGVQRGERVNVKMSLPVTFRLDGGSAASAPQSQAPASKEQIDAIRVFESASEVDFDWVAVMSVKSALNINRPIETYKETAARNGATAIIKGGAGFEHLPEGSFLREQLSDPAIIVMIRPKN